MSEALDDWYLESVAKTIVGRSHIEVATVMNLLSEVHRLRAEVERLKVKGDEDGSS